MQASSKLHSSENKRVNLQDQIVHVKTKMSENIKNLSLSTAIFLGEKVMVLSQYSFIHAKN